MSRNKIRDDYEKGLSSLGFKAQQSVDKVTHNVQSLVFKVPEGVNRDSLVTYLRTNEVETTLGTYCLSGTTYYNIKYQDIQANSKFLEDNTITFPCYDGVDSKYIIDTISAYS